MMLIDARLDGVKRLKYMLGGVITWSSRHCLTHLFDRDISTKSEG